MWELIGMRCLNFSLRCQMGCVSVICFHIAGPKSSDFKLECFVCSLFCRLLTWTVFIGGGSSLLPWGLAMLTHDFESSWQTGWGRLIPDDFIHMSEVSAGAVGMDGGGWDSLSTDASLQEGHHPWEGSLSLFLRCQCSRGWPWKLQVHWSLEVTQVTYPSF